MKGIILFALCLGLSVFTVSALNFASYNIRYLRCIQRVRMWPSFVMELTVKCITDSFACGFF
jgi:hypothetical protein